MNKNNFIKIVIACVLITLVSYFLFTRTNIVEGNDDFANPVNIPYWLCDLQIDDNQALYNSIYRPVQSFFSLSQLKDTIKGQPGGTFDGRGQSYKIREMTDTGKMGDIIPHDASDDKIKAILDNWKKKSFSEWKGKTVYDRTYQIGQSVKFLKGGNMVDGVIETVNLNEGANSTLTGVDESLMRIAKLNDATSPPTFDVKGKDGNIEKGIKFDDIQYSRSPVAPEPAPVPEAEDESNNYYVHYGHVYFV